MKKMKKLIVCGLFAIISTLAFAQETEKKDLHWYFGGETGLFSTSVLSGCYTGFEMTPFVGIKPFEKLPDCSLEFALQMDFIKLELSALGYSVGTVNWNVVSPQVLFGWKYEIGSFEPFMKLGAGINFNAAKHNSEKLNAPASVGIVVNPGFEYAINDKTVLILSGRFNMNTTSISYDGDTLFDKFGCGTKSFVIGFKYSK